VKVATNLIPLIALTLLLLLGVLALLRRGVFRSLVATAGTVLILVLVLAGGALAYLATEAEARYLEHQRQGDKEPLADNPIPKPVADWVWGQMTEEQKKPLEKAQKLQEEIAQANKSGKRAVTLAGAGIPAEGA